MPVVDFAFRVSCKNCAASSIWNMSSVTVLFETESKTHILEASCVCSFCSMSATLILKLRVTAPCKRALFHIRCKV